MSTPIRRRTPILVGLAIVCIAVLAGGVIWGQLRGDSTREDACPVAALERQAEPQFVDADALLPEGSVGEERGEVVEAINGLGPVGEVESGRFYEREQDVPALVPYGEQLMLVSAVRGEPAQLSAVDAASSGAPTRWTTELAPGGEEWTTFTGGAVGPDWVSVFSGPAPTMLTVGDDGVERACLALPIESAGTDVTVVTDQAGSEVVVLASTGIGGSWLGRLDPADGSEVATREMQGPETWQDVKVVDDLVVASRWVPSTIGTNGAPRPGEAQASWVAAWDLDGEPLWSYPAEGEEPVAAVVLDVGDDGTSYLVSFDRGGPFLDAVSPGGERTWRTQLVDGEWSGELWEDVVVMRGPDPQGGAQMRAFDAADGKPRWTVRARQAPPVGDDPLSGFGTPLTQDDAWWVPSPNGLLRIDRTSAEVERVDSKARVDQLLALGERVLVRSGEAVLITR